MGRRRLIEGDIILNISTIEDNYSSLAINRWMVRYRKAECDAQSPTFDFQIVTYDFRLLTLAGVGSGKSEAGNQKSEIGSRKSEVGNRKSDSR